MKEKVAQYYEDTRKYYSSYHNHKEASAWGGIVLYVLFCGAAARLDTPNSSVLWFNIGFSVFVAAIALSIILYVKNQYTLKDVAAAHTAAATFLLAEIILCSESKFDAREYMAIEESADVRYQASHVLPKKLLEKSKVMATRGGFSALITKLLAYGIILVISSGVVLTRWAT